MPISWIGGPLKLARLLCTHLFFRRHLPTPIASAAWAIALGFVAIVGCSSESKPELPFLASPSSTSQSDFKGKTLVNALPGEVALKSSEYVWEDTSCDTRFGEYEGTLTVRIYDPSSVSGYRMGLGRAVAVGILNGQRVEAASAMVIVAQDFSGLLSPQKLTFQFTKPITDCQLWTVFMS